MSIWEKLAPDEERQFVDQMLATRTSCTVATSMGRWFDAVAGLLGLCRENRYEAEAAMALEAAASKAAGVEVDDDAFALADIKGCIEVDLRPTVPMIVKGLQRGRGKGQLALLFHEATAAAWAAAVLKASKRTGLTRVALSGGVFCNQLLSRSLTRRLQAAGMEVLRHRCVPPNDGGIALGQAAVAAIRVTSAVGK